MFQSASISPRQEVPVTEKELFELRAKGFNPWRHADIRRHQNVMERRFHANLGLYLEEFIGWEWLGIASTLYVYVALSALLIAFVTQSTILGIVGAIAMAIAMAFGAICVLWCGRKNPQQRLALVRGHSIWFSDRIEHAKIVPLDAVPLMRILSEYYRARYELARLMQDGQVLGLILWARMLRGQYVVRVALCVWDENLQILPAPE